MTKNECKKKSISGDLLMRLARDLKSTQGENPEYDRALAELVTDALGLPVESTPVVADWLGIAEK